MCNTCNKMAGIGRKRTKKMANKRSYRRRRISGLNQKDLQGIVTQQLLPGVAGYIAGDYLLGMIKNETLSKYGRWVKMAAGLALAGTQKGMAQAAGVGLAMSGGVELVQDAMSGDSNRMGFLPNGANYAISNLNGVPEMVEGQMP